MGKELSAEFSGLLESAARLQEAVPDAVVVGGTAAVFHVGHRTSYDHDHVVQNLKDRYEAVLEAVERLNGWSIDPNVSSPPMTIMGELDGYQAGLRNLRRARPLEVEEVELGSGKKLRVPTMEETLRVKTFVASQRRAVRDFVDVAAVSAALEVQRSAAVVAAIGEYYEPEGDREPIGTAVVRALADPRPKDTRTIRTLSSYKGLSKEWSDWDRVCEQCRELAVAVTRSSADEGGGSDAL